MAYRIGSYTRITHRVPRVRVPSITLPTSQRLLQSSSSPSVSATDPEAIKRAKEREILNPERAETAQSGTDNIVGHHQAAYDPSVTNPEKEFAFFEQEIRQDGEVDPLFISPANRDFSQLLNPLAGGAVQGLDKLGPSSKGWTRKHKEVVFAGEGDARYKEYERLLRGLRKLQKRDGLAGSKDGAEKKV